MILFGTANHAEDYAPLTINDMKKILRK